MAESEYHNIDPFTPVRDAFRRLYQLDAVHPSARSHGDPHLRRKWKTSSPLAPRARADALLALARQHRVMALLHAGGIVPVKDAAWKRQIFGGVVHATRMQEEAGRLWQRLSPKMDSLLLIKGPGLAQQAWPTAELREYDDLDFRCDRRDYPALCNILEQAGYRPQHADRRRNANLWHYGWGVAFFHPDGFMVEANHRLFPPSSPCPAKAFTNRQYALPSRHASIGKANIRIPTPAAHLLLACIHALWHSGERLAWFADIAGLMVRHPGLSGQAARLAERSNFARVALQAGILSADTLFGPGLVTNADMPPLPAQAAGRAAATAQLVLDTLHRGSSPSQDERLALQRQLVSPPQRVRLFLRCRFTPGDGDFQTLSCPRRLRPLYWLYRPLRGAMQRISTKAAFPARPIGAP